MRASCSDVPGSAGHIVPKPWGEVSMRRRHQHGHHDWKGEKRWTILRRRTEREGTEQGPPPAIALFWEEENKTRWPHCCYHLELWFSVASVIWNISPAQNKERLPCELKHKWYSRQMWEVPVATSCWKSSPQLFSISAETAPCPSGYDINILQVQRVQIS